LQALENIEYSKKKKRMKDTESDNCDINEDTNDDSKIVLETMEYETDYLKIFTEFLLLLTLYVVLSQPFVVSFASNYIYQLNPTDDGTISMTGIIIYGFILTLLFMVLRKLIFSRM